MIKLLRRCCSDKMMNIEINVKNRGKLEDPIIDSGSQQWSFDDPLTGVIGALLTCKIHTLKIHAPILKVKIDELNFYDIESKLNLDGFLGKPGEISMIHHIKGRAEIKSSSDPSKVEELHQMVRKCCPIYNMLTKSGVDIDIPWKIVN